MKKIFTFTLLAACLLPLAASAGQHLRGSVFSPEQGIICDKKSGFCADREGISLGFTGEYLGEQAQQKFSNIINSVKNFDTSSFTLSNGIFCDAGRQLCFTDKHGETVDNAHTEALFDR